MKIASFTTECTRLEDTATLCFAYVTVRLRIEEEKQAKKKKAYSEQSITKKSNTPGRKVK